LTAQNLGGQLPLPLATTQKDIFESTEKNDSVSEYVRSVKHVGAGPESIGQ